MLRNLNRISRPNYLKANFFLKGKTPKFATNLTVESFASGSNTIYIEHLYSMWLSDPVSVDISWQNYFRNVDSGLASGSAFQSPPTIDPSKFNLLKYRLFVESAI
jgi:hypothetical protein